jgi:hypothetical protein
MLGLPLGFANPLILAALIALPALYWLLRMTPPPPRVVPLPTLALVRDIERKEETPATTPWWLLLLRLLIAALIILAMAGPIWNPRGASPAGSGPLLIVIDNGWSAAPDWMERRERAAELLAAAQQSGRPVAIRATGEDPREITPEASGRVEELLRSMQPLAHTPDAALHEPSIALFLQRFRDSEIAWISDGVRVGDGETALQRVAVTAGQRLTIYADPTNSVVALAGPSNAADALTVRVIRPDASQASAATLRALDNRSRVLGETGVQLRAGSFEAEARFDLPLELRNEITRVEIARMNSAGAVVLLDGRNKRRRVGIISGESADTAQPLVSPVYFIARALGPFADVREAPRGLADPYGRLIDEGATALVLADVGTLTGSALQRLTQFVDNGGVLIRFAGRRGAAPSDALMPVKLRRTERVLGGALSWEAPKKLGAFSAGSPFEGLKVPTDVTVTQQILAEPDATLTAKTWAALEDGTPMITGEARGKGVVALFHVTADTSWSTLPLSGSFVETLRRLVALAQGAGESADERSTDLAPPLRTLDGQGVFRSPPATARPIPRQFNQPGNAQHPPGFYGTLDATVAVNVLAPDVKVTMLDLSALSARREPIQSQPPLDLRPAALSAAMGLFLLDAIAALLLSGALIGMRWKRGAAAAVLLGVASVGLLAQQNEALAQTPPAQERLPAFRADDVEAALTTRLAYVITGDREVDETSRQGLVGLGRALATRTALEPGTPMGVDPARDELVFYPLLYWPIVATRPMPSEAAIRRIDTFMKQGGTIIFDTRDALTNRPGGQATPETRMLRQILANLDVPELEPVPKDHVITKSFYIIDTFIGRYMVGQTWIEILARNPDGDRGRPARAGDRVSPIIITSNDLAAAWAVDRNGMARYPLVPGENRQREMSVRGGVNIVMYALTGNYKADQVHIPALLERLGQ